MIKNNKFNSKNKRNKALCCIILIGVMVMFNLVLASALEFDNVKQNPIIEKDQSYLVGDVEVPYKELWEKYSPIEIDNAFGWGEKIFQGAITKHTESCGSNCESVLEVYHSGGELIQDIRFIGNQPISYGLFISDEYKDELINDYETKCVNGKTIINQSGSYTPQECSRVLVGSHIEKVPIWREVGLREEVLQGNYRIKVAGEIPIFSQTDWQIKVAGSWLEDWALWDSGIVSYYKLDETSGTIVNDATDYLNGTNNGSVVGQGGKINTAYKMGGGTGYIDTNNANMNKTISVSMWINGTFNQEGYLIARLDGATGGKMLLLNANGSLGLAWDSSPNDIVANTKVTNNTWNHIVSIWNATDSTGTIYLNGNLVANGALGAQVNSTNRLRFSGRWSTANIGSAVLFNGSMDEIGIWNRTLTSTEVSELYNSGTGLPYLGGLCLLEYNGTNQSISCDSSQSITINYPILVDYATLGGSLDVNYTSGATNYSTSITLTNQKNFTIYRTNDTGSYTQVHSWDYKLFETDEYFVASTFSGATTPFNISIDTNSQITLAYLNYNGTNYLGSISSSGDSYVLSRNNIAPSVSSTTNLSFYWNITRADAFNYGTTPQNQSVSPVIINETCGDGMYVISNITLLDELTQIKINETSHNSSIKIDVILFSSSREQQITNFSKNFNGTNPVSFCINSNLSNSETYSMDMQIQYSATNYSTELYNTYNTAISSSTLNNTLYLYDLPTENAQEFKINVRDTSYLPLKEALINIERKYIDEGIYKTTEIPKTDAKGITSASLEVNDVLYNFYVYKNGILISSFEDVIAICQNPLVRECEIELNAFRPGIDIPNFGEDADFNFTLGYNSTSRVISSTFVIPSGNPSTIELEIISQDSLGTTINTSTITSASGTLSIPIPSSFGNSSVIAKIYKDDIEYGRGTIKVDQSSEEIFGVVLVTLSVLVMITLIGLAVTNNPVVSAVFIFIGVILITGMNLIQNNGFIGASATILFLAIALILIIIKASRRT